MYGPSDESESIATIRAALDAGITLLDTGDFYGMGHNELLIREALKGRSRERVFIQVKFGAQRDPAAVWPSVQQFGAGDFAIAARLWQNGRIESDSL